MESRYDEQLKKDTDYYPDVGKTGARLEADYNSICKFGKDPDNLEWIDCDSARMPEIMHDREALELAFKTDAIPDDHLPAQYGDMVGVFKQCVIDATFEENVDNL